MCGVIYKITNLINSKIYVGQTIHFNHRMQHHKNSNRIGVDAAIKKYGWENFKVEVIEECPVEKLDEREIFWIAYYDCVAPKGYNLTSGGTAHRILSDETRAKLSAIAKKWSVKKILSMANITLQRQKKKMRWRTEAKNIQRKLNLKNHLQ